MTVEGSIAIPIRTIRSSSISMRSPQRRRRAPKPMLRERGDNDRQAIAHHEGGHSSSLWFRWLFFRRLLRQHRMEGLSANRRSFADNVPDSEAKTLSVNLARTRSPDRL